MPILSTIFSHEIGKPLPLWLSLVSQAHLPLWDHEMISPSDLKYLLEKIIGPCWPAPMWSLTFQIQLTLYQVPPSWHHLWLSQIISTYLLGITVTKEGIPPLLSPPSPWSVLSFFFQRPTAPPVFFITSLPVSSKTMYYHIFLLSLEPSISPYSQALSSTWRHYNVFQNPRLGSSILINHLRRSLYELLN